MNRIIIILLNLLLLFSPLYCENLEINDSNVRVRSAPTVNSKILGRLQKMETATFLGKLEGGTAEEDYKWVNIDSKFGMGWVYGEFLDYTDNKSRVLAGRLYNTKEAVVVYKNIDVYIGMPYSTLEKNLGKPLNVFNDSEYNEKIYQYEKDKSFNIIVSIFSKRITHIIINRSDVSLKSGIKIGNNIDEIMGISISTKFTKSDQTYSCNLAQLFYSDYFIASVIFDTDSKHLITSIQIGSPGID